MKCLSFSDFVDQQLPLFRVCTSWGRSGRTNAKIGTNFENLIIMSNQSYENKNLGVVKKNNIATKYVKGKYFYSEKSTVDFDGWLDGVGFVAFDCKSTDHDSFWAPDRRALHQYLYLLRLSRIMPREMGRAFYLIEWRQPRTPQWYIVQDLEQLKLDGRYRFNDAHLVGSSPGFFVDYRHKLLEMVDDFSA